MVLDCWSVREGLEANPDFIFNPCWDMGTNTSWVDECPPRPLPWRSHWWQRETPPGRTGRVKIIMEVKTGYTLDEASWLLRLASAPMFGEARNPNQSLDWSMGTNYERKPGYDGVKIEGFPRSIFPPCEPTKSPVVEKMLPVGPSLARAQVCIVQQYSSLAKKKKSPTTKRKNHQEVLVINAVVINIY